MKNIKVTKLFLMIPAFFLVSIVCFAAISKIAYRNFYSKSQKEFKIPEIHSGYVQQGLEYYIEDDVFLLCGYMNKSNNSIIFVVYPDGHYKRTELYNGDGTVFKNHTGGISVFGEFVYMAGCDGKIYVLDKKAALDPMHHTATVTGAMEVHNRADFCYIKDRTLYVGEYYLPHKFETDPTHHIKTPAGDKNNAVITTYALDHNSSLGINTTPQAMYSITGKIQGLCITDENEFILSASSGISHSSCMFTIWILSIIPLVNLL